MLLERMGETVTLEPAEGDPVSVRHVLVHEAEISDQSVMDVQTRFINQARYKGDSRTLTVLWPKTAPHALMDAHLVIRGERYRVYGDPFPVAHSPNGYDVRITCTRPLFLYDAELLAPTSMEFDEWGKPSWKWERVPTKANLLRRSEMTESEAAQMGLADVCLIELPPGTWDARYKAFALGGGEFAITSVDVAHDVVVIGGRAEVTDG